MARQLLPLHRLQQLPGLVGIQLLDRHTRGVELTPAGEVFLERARATLAAAETAQATRADLEVFMGE